MYHKIINKCKFCVISKHHIFFYYLNVELFDMSCENNSSCNALEENYVPNNNAVIIMFCVNCLIYSKLLIGYHKIVNFLLTENC